MRDMMVRGFAFGVALAALSTMAGCAGSRGDAISPSVKAPAGTLAVRVQNHLEWPYRLRRLVIAVDGEVKYEKALLQASSGAALPAVELTVPARPGHHHLAVYVVAGLPVGGGDAECAAEMRAAESFTVSDTPVQVDADLYLRAMPTKFDQRLSMNVRLSGAGATLLPGPTRDTASSCAIDFPWYAAEPDGRWLDTMRMDAGIWVPVSPVQTRF